MQEKTLKVFHTHLEIFPYKEGESELIERKCSIWVEAEFRYEPKSFVVVDDTLYLPRGFDLNIINKEFKIKNIETPKADKSAKMTSKIKLLAPPRDAVQEAAIEYLLCKGRYQKADVYSQQALILGTGVGKTFIGMASIVNLRQRALIITHQEKIKMHWINTFKRYTDVEDEAMVNISGPSVMDKIIDGELEGDIYFVNHRTLSLYLKNNGYKRLRKFFKKLQIGVKLYDEAHLEFVDTTKIDFFSNTKKTFYFTATFYKSADNESKLFLQAFSSACKFDDKDAAKIKEFRKHIYYVPVLYDSKPTWNQENYCNTQYGLSTVRFAKRAFERDPRHTMLNAFCDVMDKIIAGNPEGKILITVGLIDNITAIEEILRSQYPEYTDDKTIMYVHSKQPKEDNEKAKVDADIIISTIKSSGTGVDINKLRVIINMDPFSSKVTSKQLSGRLREYAPDKFTFFFDLIDMGFKRCRRQYENKKRFFEDIAYKVKVMDIR